MARQRCRTPLGMARREGKHHTIWVLLTDLGDQKCSHTGASATSEGVGQLEALEAIARFGLLTDNIE